MPQHKKEPAAMARSGPLKADYAGLLTKSSNNPAHGRGQSAKSRSANVVAIVQKSATSELRISITSWRGSSKIELREATALISGVYFPTGTYIAIDVSKLGELIAALQAAEAEARKLLPDEERAP